MARKKKDFWDGVDDARVVVEKTADSRTQTAEEEWSAVKSTPIKVIMRILLMISCLAALASGFIAYQFIQDRYAGGSYSTDYFNSGSFAKEYNNSVEKLLGLVEGIEADPSVLREGNEQLLSTLTENYMGKDTNFSFLIQDEDHFQLVSSGDDAKDRIEASNHYALISNTEGETTVKSSIPGNLLEKDKWSEVLSQTSSKYIIYTTVDNELTRQDSFYASSQNFDRMQEYFRYARIIGIVAAVLFILSLIFCIMATGMKRGVDGVSLTWFDRIFTEIAVIIMAVVGAAIIYGIYRLYHMDGDVYRYGAAGLAVVAYIWFARCYFSIVRRIKAGQLLRHSVIGTIIGFFARLVGKLPKPLNYIVGALILIAINGGLVYCLITQRAYTYRGIPIVFIAAPIILIIELLALLVHNSGSAEEEEELIPQENTLIEELAEEIREEKAAQIAAADDEREDVREYIPSGKTDDMEDSAGLLDEETEAPEWESMDLSQEIEEAKNQEETAAEEAAAAEQQTDSANPHTLVLSENEIEKALREAGFGVDGEAVEETPTQAEQTAPAKEAEPENEQQPEQEAPAAETVPQEAAAEDAPQETASEEAAAEIAPAEKINFVELNKEVRKTFRPRLKARGIMVTMRAPEKPIYIDMDRESMTALAKNVFEQIERFSADQVKNYIETYVQGGRVVYIAKVHLAEGQAEAAAAAVHDDSFAQARSIAQAGGGRFVVSVEDDILRAGMLIDEAK